MPASFFSIGAMRFFKGHIKANLACDQAGFSRVEVICLCGLAAVALVLILVFGSVVLNYWHTGNDSMTLNTAEGCGNAMLSDACLVSSCPGKGSAKHKMHVDERGRNFAYFDKISNSLTDVRPQGYNETKVTTTDGRAFETGQAVVKVTRQGNSISVGWALGE